MDDWYNEDGQQGSVGRTAIGGTTQPYPSGIPSSMPTTGGAQNFGNQFYAGSQTEYGKPSPYADQGVVGKRIGGDDEEDYSNEPPLLEELGINFEHIWAKTRVVLILTRRINSSHLEDTDLAGPLVFALAFGFLLLLKGKVCVCGVAMMNR